MQRHLLASLLLFAACGTVESGPDDLVDHSGLDAGPEPGVAPTVVAVDPPSGSLVDEDVAITITFSEPMDRSSVEGALGFPGGAAPELTWNGDGTAVTAARHVPYPEGSDPDQVAPGSLSVTLGDAAADLDGDPLADQLELEYTLRYRRITTSFPAGATLTGNCDPVCSGNWTWFAAGERSSDPTVATRGYLTVPFELPDGIAIEHAELHTEIQQVIDNPFSSGDLMIDHVQFDAITGGEYAQRGLGLGVLFARTASPAAGDTVTIDVTSVFASDYQDRVTLQNRTQYRVRFPHDLPEDPSYPAYHADDNWDIVQMLLAGTGVTVTYLAP